MTRTRQTATPIEFGARVELRRLASPSEVVVYEVRWVMPDRVPSGRATVHADGSIAVEVDEPSADAATDAAETSTASVPEWLLKFTESLLRLLRRGIESDEGATWPRRITRWKTAPEGR